MDTDGRAVSGRFKADNQLRWYAIQTYSGQENKAKAHLEKAVSNQGLTDRIPRALVPTEEVTEVRDGRRITIKRKFYPSYVLVQMVLDEETWHLVMNTPGVSRFVGGGDQPMALKESEVARVVEQAEKGRTKTIREVPFELGDSVMVVDGPFNGFSGVVEEVDPERGKVKVMVTIFGRATPVELEFSHVKPL
ncbi:MAG: transcription termination/antitermination protein NusG [Candidatus Eisenbacteria bacterium]|jgi:transcriptional antiterminator NusG|nr:transcription termination/antitermination protein NusG [Candidatus Eisenbacteria bacterium]